MAINKHHSDRLRRVVKIRWVLPAGTRDMMFRALDKVDQGVIGARVIIRAIIKDLREGRIRRTRSRGSRKEGIIEKSGSRVAA